MRFIASFSFQRASRSAAVQNIVLSVASFGAPVTRAAAPPRPGAAAATGGPVRTSPTVSKRISHALKPFISVKW